MALEGGVYNGSFSISLANAETSSLLVATSYIAERGTRYEPQAGHWSYWTQAIGNAFPLWHGARRNPIGRTQSFLNHAAVGVEEAGRTLTHARRNLYLETSDAFQPDRGYVVPLSRAPRDFTEIPNSNLLSNADFSIPGLARYGTPASWSKRGSATTGVVELYPQNSLTGTGCIRFTVEAGEVSYLHQFIRTTAGETRDGAQVVEMTASIWVLIPLASTSVETTGYLTLTLGYEDGSAESFREALPTGTDAGWRRVKITGQASKRVTNADFQIRVENSSGSSLEVFADAAQMELGTKARPWAPNVDDSPTWWTSFSQAPVYLHAIGAASSRSAGGFDYTEYEHVRVWVTSSEDDWWERALPSRLGVLGTDSSSSVGQIKNLWGFHAESEGRDRRTTKLQVNATTDTVDLLDNRTNDLYESYDLADLNVDQDEVLKFTVWGDEDTGFTRDLEALTIHRDLAWVVGKETYQGTTTRVLKVCRPHTNGYVLADDDLSNYLEVIQDYDMGDTTGTCTAIGFPEGDEEKLMLTIDGTSHSVGLHYDYAYWAASHEVELISRHEYTGYDLVIT